MCWGRNGHQKSIIWIIRMDADTVYDEVKVQNGALEQTTPAGGNGEVHITANL